MGRKVNEAAKKANEDRRKCTDLLLEILDYPPEIKLPTITYRKLKDYKDVGYDVVYDTIRQQRESIEWALNNKSFDGEVRKIQYIFAIVQNHIIEVLRERKREEQKMAMDEKNIPESLEIGNNVKMKVKDLSQYVKEG